MDLDGQVELGRSAQRLAQNLTLDPELMLVVGVLIVASPTAREVRASGLYAVRRSLDYGFRSGTGKSRFLPGDSGFDLFLGQNEWNESCLARPAFVCGKAGDAVAAINKFFDREEQALILNQ